MAALGAACAGFLVLGRGPAAQVGAVQKISAIQGGFEGTLLDSNAFGQALAYLGDMDGDGIGDVAVESLAVGEVWGGPEQEGAVWILSLRPDGTVAAERRIDDGEPAEWPNGRCPVRAGRPRRRRASCESPRGRAGAPFDDDGGFNRGAFYTLLLGGDGSVRAFRKVAEPDLGPVLVDWDRFGAAIALLADLEAPGGPHLGLSEALDVRIGSPAALTALQIRLRE